MSAEPERLYGHITHDLAHSLFHLAPVCEECVEWVRSDVVEREIAAAFIEAYWRIPGGDPDGPTAQEMAQRYVEHRRRQHGHRG